MPAATVSPTIQDVYTAVGNFILAQLGLASGQVIQLFQNRTAMPLGPFVGMRAMSKKRLRTNEYTWDQTNSDPTTQSYEQGQQVTMQLDCYGPNSSEWADVLSTLLRSQVGCDALAPNCQPLSADDPIRAPLIDAEEQYEDRWIVQALIQYNPVVVTPQQFADTLTVAIINVDVEYPP